MDLPIISVSQLNIYVKSLLEANQHLKSVYISGEISNFTNHYSSGHFYLTLKDDKASIKAVMFRSSAQKIPFKPENGMKVICKGRVSLYERDGAYQLYIDEMQPDGVGALQLAFEQLKVKLSEAGLFDEEIKRPIPHFPSKVAVITSSTGAALQDIVNVISRRYPIAELVVCPALVQGEQAPASLICAVRRVNELNCADVIIIGRGGGSIEDLWAFNDEGLAYAIFESKIPIISAVGHEVDFTICDFVADLRAPTPSAAAELAVPDILEIKAYMTSFEANLVTRCNSILQSLQERLNYIASRHCLLAPESYLDNISEHVDLLEQKIVTVYNQRVDNESNNLAVVAARIDAMSPLKTMSRGYSIATLDNAIIKSADVISVNDKIKLMLIDGDIVCSVTDIIKKDEIYG